MKTLKRLFILMLLAAAVVGGFMLGSQHGDGIEKAKTESTAAASSAGQALHDAVNEGKQLANELTAHVSAKTRVAASNLVSAVGDMTTNAVNEAKKKLKDAVN